MLEVLIEDNRKLKEDVALMLRNTKCDESFPKEVVSLTIKFRKISNI